MIDIHCHLLYGVDDGPDSLEESAAMLLEAKNQGVQALILTPHYRHGMFPYENEVIARHFQQVQQYAAKMGVAIFLGCEYHMNTHSVEHLRSGRCKTLAGSEYVLAEYSTADEYLLIRNMTQELLLAGYIPIIAHVERYTCLLEHPERVAELAALGALIQVNADAVLGVEGRKHKQFCKHLLKEELVDFIASDSHGVHQRPSRMGKCRDHIRKKYGEEAARQIFIANPLAILRAGGS